MDRSRTDRRTRSFYSGLKQWDEWLTDRLAPADVVVADPGVFSEVECRWRVIFPSGSESLVRVPRSLITCDAEEFGQLTDRLDQLCWVEALELAGLRGLRLSSRHPTRRLART